MDNPKKIAAAKDRSARFKTVVTLLRSMPGSMIKPFKHSSEIQAASTLGVTASILQVIRAFYFALMLKYSGREANGIDPAAIGIWIIIALYIIAAYRFESGKGLIIGSIILVLTILTTVANIAYWTNDAENYYLIIFSFITVIGDAFGVRAAWANRKRERRAP